MQLKTSTFFILTTSLKVYPQGWLKNFSQGLSEVISDPAKTLGKEAVSKIDELKKAIKEELTLELKEDILEEIRKEANKKE